MSQWSLLSEDIAVASSFYVLHAKNKCKNVNFTRKLENRLDLKHIYFLSYCSFLSLSVYYLMCFKYLESRKHCRCCCSCCC